MEYPFSLQGAPRYPEILLTRRIDMKHNVPIWEKSNLTVEEAAAYSGVGINKLRELSNKKDCDFVLWVGSKRLIKRQKLDDYLKKQYSI